ncbi:porin [Undibacterium arcticum]|uniref:porin n=1 Tax=Undibacterium arcticum TaxID=1762892 RepID=UPI0036093F1B
MLAIVALGSAATASAQSSVQFSGVIDTFAGDNQLSGNSHRVANVGTGGLSTAYFGFTGTEDLGGGLQAEFALSSPFQSDNGLQGRFANDTLFSRDANVGIKGGFGAIKLGRYTSPNFLSAVQFNPFGNSTVVAPLLLHSYVPTFGDLNVWRNSIAGDSGWSNQIAYITPDFDGFKADFHYQFGEVAGNSGKNNVGARAFYFKGPLGLTAYVQRVQVNNPLDAGGVTSALNTVGTPTSQRAWFIGGSYDFSSVKLFGTYQQTTNNVDANDKTVQLGSSIPVGAGNILASWAQTRRAGSVVGADLKRNTASVGYDYVLSKRTDLYTVYMYDKISSQDQANSILLGIRHRF